MKNIIVPAAPVYITAWASAVGSEEARGPLSGLFDVATEGDDLFGEDTWEKAEARLLSLALERAVSKAGLEKKGPDLFLSGDLLNQCTASAFTAAELDFPFLGLFGACSTAAEGLLTSALLCSAYSLRAICAASSHNATAERQFRSPLEYGGQRSPTAQWTVTGAGAFAVSSRGKDVFFGRREGDGYALQIRSVTPGRVVDAGITDSANMGAAMAPAAADTLCRFYEDGGSEDAQVVTGDLGYEGSEILKDIMCARGRDISSLHSDCGLMIYDRKRQDKHAGASGCGCSAAVMASVFCEGLRRGSPRELLFVGTGALMNGMTVAQGCSIPSVAHLVHIGGKAMGEVEK